MILKINKYRENPGNKMNYVRTKANLNLCNYIEKSVICEQDFSKIRIQVKIF